MEMEKERRGEREGGMVERAQRAQVMGSKVSPKPSGLAV